MTAAHNFSPIVNEAESSNYYGLTKIVEGTNIGVFDIIRLQSTAFAQDEEEDWIVLSRVDGSFPSSVTLCSETTLPVPGGKIEIKDYPVGLFSSRSSNVVSVTSITSSVTWYEAKMEPSDEPALKARKVQAIRSYKVVELKEPVDVTKNCVVTVKGGRVSGSRGAPYFTTNGDVFAFHFEAIDDFDASVSDSRSLETFSHGYVLCRLPAFKIWYNANIACNEDSRMI